MTNATRIAVSPTIILEIEFDADRERQAGQNAQSHGVCARWEHNHLRMMLCLEH